MSAKVTPKQVTNKKKNSLVKVVVTDDAGKWKSPNKDSSFEINGEAVFPGIKFEHCCPRPARVTAQAIA